MLDTSRIQEAARRGADVAALVDEWQQANDARKELQGRLDTLRQQRNEANQAMAKADKKSDEFGAMRDRLRDLSGQIKAGEADMAELEGRSRDLLLSIPNAPHASVPDGASEQDNQVVSTWGTAPSFDFEPKAHWDLGEALGILDFERAAKVSGARFAFLRGDGSRLNRALLMFMLDLHGSRGYTEVWPPALVRRHALVGTGQLPKFEEDAFKVESAARESDGSVGGEASDGSNEYFLVPTAEVPVTNLHREEILDAEQLPIHYCAYSPCFRAEAGSYGKDTRGLIRQHQFDKVELVKFVAPDESYDELELLREDAEWVLRKLGLHYRVVNLCLGDLSFTSAKTYDIEVWLPGQSAYREISSCSNFEDFQARRAKIRYRPAPKEKPRMVHTLNGSGLAIGRTIVAILEQYQQADGTVIVPEVLRPYMGGEAVLVPGHE